MTTQRLTTTLVFALALTGCGDDDLGDSRDSSFSSSPGDGDGDGDPGEADGDGDGDGPGDGDGAAGDGDGEAGDGDGEPPGDGDGGPGDGDGAPAGNCPNGDSISIEAVLYNDFGVQPPIIIDDCVTSYGAADGSLIVTYMLEDSLLTFSLTNPGIGGHEAVENDPGAIIQFNLTGGVAPGWLGFYQLGSGTIELLDYGADSGHVVVFHIEAMLVNQDDDTVDLTVDGAVTLL